jgi:predicted transcriptional regulator
MREQTDRQRADRLILFVPLVSCCYCADILAVIIGHNIVDTQSAIKNYWVTIPSAEVNYMIVIINIQEKQMKIILILNTYRGPEGPQSIE